MKKILLALLLVSFLGCLKKDSTNLMKMADVQQELLTNHEEKSFDLVEDMTEKGVLSIIQTENISLFDTSSLSLSTITLSLPESIEIPIVVETENYYYAYNAILSPTLNNIAQYNKSGELIKSFGRKGNGPGEVTTISSISEKNHITYLFDNGHLKRFNEYLDEIDRSFLKLWVNDVKLNSNSYDVRISDNTVFPYPLSNLDYQSDSINFSIKDTRAGALNFTSSNETSFYSNDSLLIYAKTTLDYIHIIDKSNLSNTKHYQIKSPIIRKNEQLLDKKSINKEKFYNFMNSLFLINKIHLDENIIWLSLIDRNSKENKHYLGRIELDTKLGDTLPLKIFDVSTSFKTVHFFQNHLFYTKRDMVKKQIHLTKIKLEYL